MIQPIYPQVAYDFAVDEAEPIDDQKIVDLCLEQWTDDLSRIYLAPGQVPRVVHAMLEALRDMASLGDIAVVENGLRRAFDDRRVLVGLTKFEWDRLLRLVKCVVKLREISAKPPATAESPAKARRRKRTG